MDRGAMGKGWEELQGIGFGVCRVLEFLELRGKGCWYTRVENSQE